MFENCIEIVSTIVVSINIVLINTNSSFLSSAIILVVGQIRKGQMNRIHN